MRVDEVFTPNDVPSVTYVTREDHKLEEQLRAALKMRNTVVSISGPSKAGKTVTLKKIIDQNYVITLSGSNIKGVNDLWRQIFAWIGETLEITKSDGVGFEIGIRTNIEGEAGIPLLAKGKAGAGADAKVGHQSGQTKVVPIDPYQKIAEEIGGSDFVIFIDDFHYIEREAQKEISKCIKTLAENNVKFCLASVPHRSDDAVRANTELRGRLATVDFTYWGEEELQKIALQGFEALNIKLNIENISKLARESIGSPQLMQLLCLNVCGQRQIKERQQFETVIDLSAEELKEILERASQFANFSSTLQAMHSGPRVRGNERKQFRFVDESTGDVYRAILLAIRSDPRALTFRYDDILERVKAICVGESPSGSSITSSLAQMEEIAEASGGSAILDWDEDNLNVIEPYFLFYLRCSPKINQVHQNDRLSA